MHEGNIVHFTVYRQQKLHERFGRCVLIKQVLLWQSLQQRAWITMHLCCCVLMLSASGCLAGAADGPARSTHATHYMSMSQPHEHELVTQEYKS